MNATTTTVETGTVKVGRWTYPATRVGGAVTRNEKRDGTGAPVEVDAKVAATFEASAATVVEAPAETWTDEVADAIEALTPVQRAVFTAIGNVAHRNADGFELRRFDFFDDGVVKGSGIWFDHMSNQTPNPAQTRREVRKLGGTLVEIGAVDRTLDHPDAWMALTALGAQVAVRLGGAAVDLATWAEARTSGHGGKPGAQKNKPGKSTWQVGAPCPRGTHTLTDDLIYTMPSGRHQCRGCRQGYPSNS